MRTQYGENPDENINAGRDDAELARIHLDLYERSITMNPLNRYFNLELLKVIGSHLDDAEEAGFNVSPLKLRYEMAILSSGPLAKTKGYA